MSEKTEIEQKQVGYRFHVSIDRELHVEGGTRTPDKITAHASLEGHTDTYNEAVSKLSEARGAIETLLKEAKKPDETKQDAEKHEQDT